MGVSFISNTPQEKWTDLLISVGIVRHPRVPGPGLVRGPECPQAAHKLGQTHGSLTENREPLQEAHPIDGQPAPCPAHQLFPNPPPFPSSNCLANLHLRAFAHAARFGLAGPAPPRGSLTTQHELSRATQSLAGNLVTVCLPRRTGGALSVLSDPCESPGMPHRLSWCGCCFPFQTSHLTTFIHLFPTPCVPMGQPCGGLTRPMGEPPWTPHAPS